MVGRLGAGERERQDPGGHQSPARGDGLQHEPRDPGRGVHHGQRGTPQPAAAAGRLHDVADDAGDAADAAGLPARLRAQQPRQDRLQAAAQLVHANRPRNGLSGGAPAGPSRSGRPQRPRPESGLRQNHRLWTGQAAGHQRGRVQSGRRQNAHQMAGPRVHPAPHLHPQKRRLGFR